MPPGWIRQAYHPVTFGVSNFICLPVTDDKCCLQLLTTQLALIEALGAGEQQGECRGNPVPLCTCMCVPRAGSMRAGVGDRPRERGKAELGGGEQDDNGSLWHRFWSVS